MGRTVEELQTECRQELEVAKVRLHLVRTHAERAIKEGAAFGGELSLARRILEALDKDLLQ